MNIHSPSNNNIQPEALFEEYFYSFYEGLHRYAFSILKDNEEAKDIVQFAFTRLWEKRNEVDILHAAKSYLYRTVHNLCLNTTRDKKVRDKYKDQYIPTETKVDNISDYEEKEAVKKILGVIELLPPVCKEVFSKSRFEGKKYADISLELNISIKTVEAHMGKALRVLRSLLSNVIVILIIIMSFL